MRVNAPLTYRYELREIIRKIAEVANQSHTSHVRALLEACPKHYGVILFGGQVSETDHRINATTIIVHCHLVRWARQASRLCGGEQWSLTVNQSEAQPTYSVPNCDLLEEFYPASQYYSEGTYLTHNMTIPVKYHLNASTKKSAPTGKKPKTKEGDSPSSAVKGPGTGHNKKCPYCGERTRTLVQSKSYQISHHTTNCPAIALISSNEAVILETIRQRCLPLSAGTTSTNSMPRKKENKFVTHSFVLGGEGKSRKGGDNYEFRFGSKSLLRHATQEELIRGEHINGLRLNRTRFADLSHNVQETMVKQLDGPLFGTIDADAEAFTRCLYDMEPCNQGTNVRSLLYDECGRKFLESKFDRTTKKPLHNFGREEELIFELDTSKTFSPKMQHYMGYSSCLFAAQQEFIAVSTNMMSMPPFPDLWQVNDFSLQECK